MAHINGEETEGVFSWVDGKAMALAESRVGKKCRGISPCGAAFKTGT